MHTSGPRGPNTRVLTTLHCLLTSVRRNSFPICTWAACSIIRRASCTAATSSNKPLRPCISHILGRVGKDDASRWIHLKSLSAPYFPYHNTQGSCILTHDTHFLHLRDPEFGCCWAPSIMGIPPQEDAEFKDGVEMGEGGWINIVTF